MVQEEITDSGLELMCQDICFGLGQNQDEELGLEVSPWSDVTTTYEDQNFKIVQRNPCDGGYFLRVYCKGKRVLSSSREEVIVNYGFEEEYTINVDGSDLSWINELIRLHELNWEKIRRKLEVGYLT